MPEIYGYISQGKQRTPCVALTEDDLNKHFASRKSREMQRIESQLARLKNCDAIAILRSLVDQNKSSKKFMAALAAEANRNEL